MKIIITLIMLIPFLTLSQLRVIIGKDTLNIKNVSEIKNLVDSINTANYKNYELRRKIMQDSIEIVEELEYRRAESLYYLENNQLLYEKKPDSLFLRQFKKRDSLLYFSYISTKSLDSIYKLRNLNQKVDSINIFDLFDELLINLINKDHQKSILVKEQFEYNSCDSGCVEYVISTIFDFKKLKRDLLDPKTRDIVILVYELNSIPFIRVNYKRKHLPGYVDFLIRVE